MAVATPQIPGSLMPQLEQEHTAFQRQAPIPKLKGTKRFGGPLLATLAAVAVLLAVAEGAAFRASVKRDLRQLDDEAKALNLRMEERGEEFQRLWGASSSQVRKAFITFYMPNLQGVEIKEAEVVGMYMKHVEGLRNLAVPLLRQKEERELYRKQMKLVTSVLKVATDRLRLLALLEDFHQRTMAEVPLLQQEDLKPLPPFEELEREKKDLISFEEFVKMIPGGVSPSNAGQAADKLVPKAILEKLISMAFVEETVISENAKVAELFNKEFISLFGADLNHLIRPHLWAMQPLKLAYDNSEFDCAQFVMRLHEQRMFEAPPKFVDERLMGECAANWSVRGMEKFMNHLWAYHRNRPQRKINNNLHHIKSMLRPQGADRDAPVTFLPKDHLMMLAVFLI